MLVISLGWRSLVAAASAALLAPQSADRLAPERAIPAALRTLLIAEARLTADQIEALESGAVVTKLLGTDPSREVAVFGATWIDAPASAYVAAVKDIERFERGEGFLITRRISDPPRLEDFSELDLPDEDVADLRTCRVGRCEIKLSESALERVRKEIDWSKPTAARDVKALARRVALEFVTAYQRGGNEELAVYRDAEHPTFVAREFESMIDRMPALSQYMPDLRQYLLMYPRATLPDSTAFLYWQLVKFGLKPTIRINHMVIQERPGQVLVATKQLYASHYFWTALQLQALISDPARERGFWLINVSRSRSDGLGGFVGRLIRSKVTAEAQKGLQAGLRAARATLEQSPR